MPAHDLWAPPKTFIVTRQAPVMLHPPSRERLCGSGEFQLSGFTSVKRTSYYAVSVTAH